ncbi:MAG: hypothetical protein Tsb009_33440 [Planctomycetaceae bacterium]
MCACIDEATVCLSLHEEALREANCHKWIESQKQGRDLGLQAVHDWFRNYWHAYCRYRQLEHLQGRRQWREFEGVAFGGLVAVANDDIDDLLLDRVLDRVREGFENLEMIIWAQEWGLPIQRVLEMLAVFDVNRARLEPQFHIQPSW